MRSTGLRTLLLATSFPDKPATISALRLPFRLRSLHLFNRTYSPHVLSTLFSSSSTSLESLTLLTGSSSPSYPALVRSFPLVAPNLSHLALQHRPSPALVEHFALLGRLQHLECHFAVDLASVLDALPPSGSAAASPLRTLSLELDYNLSDVSAVVVSRLVDPLRGPLRGLERLRIPRAPTRREFREFGAGALLDVCDERGVVLEVGETVAWRTRMFVD